MRRQRPWRLWGLGRPRGLGRLGHRLRALVAWDFNSGGGDAPAAATSLFPTVLKVGVFVPFALSLAFDAAPQQLVLLVVVNL